MLHAAGPVRGGAELANVVLDDHETADGEIMHTIAELHHRGELGSLSSCLSRSQLNANKLSAGCMADVAVCCHISDKAKQYSSASVTFVHV